MMMLLSTTTALGVADEDIEIACQNVSRRSVKVESCVRERQRLGGGGGGRGVECDSL